MERGCIDWCPTLDDYLLPSESCACVFDAEDARVLAWIETGMRREAVRLAKKRRRLKEHEFLILDGPADVSDGKVAMVDTIAAAVDVSGEAEGSVFVQDALSLLTPLQREVITATVLAGDTEKEAAVRLGISQQAVHRVKKRALSRLREYFVLDEPPGK